MEIGGGCICGAVVFTYTSARVKNSLAAGAVFRHRPVSGERVRELGARAGSLSRLRYLLLQSRDDSDPMVGHEIGCFARQLDCSRSDIHVHSLITGRQADCPLDRSDIVLVGGSGDYSVVTGGSWLPAALDLIRDLHRICKPTFASCWGFQAFACALGGQVVTDLQRAQLGSLPVELTSHGHQDGVFGGLPSPFLGLFGHQDIVVRLPGDAVCLGSTRQVNHVAFRFADKPIYGTQFHPEMQQPDLVQRLVAYPKYIRDVTDTPLEQFVSEIVETPESNSLVQRFVKHVTA